MTHYTTVLEEDETPKRKWYSIGGMGFLMTVVVICNGYLFASANVSQFHLKTEQSWSAELQSQNMHSLTIVAKQKDYIGKLWKALLALDTTANELRETIELQERALQLFTDEPEIELEN
jgi:hypothetical protein